LREAAGGIRLPAPEFVARLAATETPRRQMTTWLTALVRMNEGQVLLAVDGIEAWPQSAGFWPAVVPAGVFLVLSAAPDAALPEAFETLGASGAWEIDPPSSARNGAETIPEVALPLLLRLAATEVLPLEALVDQIGADLAARSLSAARPWLRQTPQGLALAQPALAPSLVAAHPEAYHAVCRQVAWWGSETVLDPDASPPSLSTARRLWRSAAECQHPMLVLRLARSEPLREALIRHLAELEKERPCAALEVHGEWQEALWPMLGREHSAIDPVAVFDRSNARGWLLLRLGASAEAAQSAWQSITRIGDMMRDGKGGLQRVMADALVLRAAASLPREMAAAAVDDCARALELYALGDADSERSGKAHHLLGKALAATDGREAAQSEMEQALALLGDPAGVAQDLASLHLQARRPEQAEKLLGRALERLTGATRAAALVRRALARGLQRKADEAVRDLEEAIAIYRDRLAAGRLELTVAAAQAHDDMAALLAGKGRLAVASDHVSEAIRLYHQAVDEQGRKGCRALLARAYSEKGLLSTRLGRDEEAIGHCSRAIDLATMLLQRERRSSLRSDLARAHNNRAQALARKGEVDSALRDYEHAIAQYTVLIARMRRYEYRHHLALVHFNRGGAHRQSGRHAVALSDYLRAIELLEEVCAEHPTRAARLDLGVACVHRALTADGEGDGARALDDYGRAIEILSKLWRGEEGSSSPGPCAEAWRPLAAALQGRGRVHLAGRRIEAAIADLTLALNLHRESSLAPSDVRTHVSVLLDRGRAAMMRQRWAAAEDDFDAAVRLAAKADAPARAAAWASLGGVRRAQGRYEEARAAYDAAIEEYRTAPTDDRRIATERVACLRARASLRLTLEGVGAALEDLDAAAAIPVASEGLLPVALENDRSRVRLAEGRWAEALAGADRALASLETLSRESAPAARLMAEAAALRGRARKPLGEHAEAIADFTRSIAAWSRLAEDAMEPAMCAELARVYADRAAVHRAARDVTNALFDYGWAIDLLGELSAAHDMRDLQSELGSACLARAVLLMNEGRIREARRDLTWAASLGASADPASGLSVEGVARRCDELLEDYKPC
jgi:tetratricopeptide (TPR) repeat protein